MLAIFAIEGISAGESFVIVIQAAGLAVEDVSLSTDEGRNNARILVHMRQSARLLQALSAHRSQLVDSRRLLTEDKTYRVIVNLPHAVAGEDQLQLARACYAFRF